MWCYLLPAYRLNSGTYHLPTFFIRINFELFGIRLPQEGKKEKALFYKLFIFSTGASFLVKLQSVKTQQCGLHGVRNVLLLHQCNI